MRTLSYKEAIREGLEVAMASDPTVFLMGEGVPDPKRIFGSTAGLLEKFGPERVFDIPLSENGMTGVMMGAALFGMRPVMTHQRIDFMMYAMDQIVNHAAKRAFASGGVQGVPMTIRAIVGRGWGQGPQHSQSLQALFAHVPGLKVVMPATPGDAKGLLISSIRDPNPVIFIEYRRLYEIVGEVPEGDFSIPLGRAVVRREGRDATIVAISYMDFEALRAAAALASIGVEVEIIDPRTLKPLDEEAILRSVRKTGRLVVADTGWRTCGVSAEIAALAAERAFDSLEAPVVRVALPDAPTPTSSVLEAAYYPGAAEIVHAVLASLGRAGEAEEAMEALPDDVSPTAFTGPF